MPTFEAKVDESGAIQLPSGLRKRLKIKPGSTVEFFLTTDGQVHFHAITGTAKGFGGIVSGVRSPPVSIREMDDAIADTIIDEHTRIDRRYRERLGKKPPSAAE